MGGVYLLLLLSEILFNILMSVVSMIATVPSPLNSATADNDYTTHALLSDAVSKKTSKLSVSLSMQINQIIMTT
ncbi:Protein CBG25404 [Caenorhabditis briggsae]|uniref:Protein CBG25404 n=1 Tax=Caenorhabditis briggsae TaxID=6238 RepID=B6IH56_CAEBR|nr:Protein CBG25404 [Caenorhabditis briggsae]CAR99236.1 Protein CBG25404 [Caenorhabditis briggsae]